MPLPATIPVKYTEGEDVYLNVRPVVRQTFRLEELLDMVLGVTGKNVERIQQILRSGTIVYHSYRYWWPGFAAEAEELQALLARLPEADPSRPFRAEECAAVLLESGEQPAHVSMEVGREAASRRRLFRSASFWSRLMSLADAAPLVYQSYSYQRHADLFGRGLTREECGALERDAARLASRSLHARLARLPAAKRVVFICPRQK